MKLIFMTVGICVLLTVSFSLGYFFRDTSSMDWDEFWSQMPDEKTEISDTLTAFIASPDITNYQINSKEGQLLSLAKADVFIGLTQHLRNASQNESPTIIADFKEWENYVASETEKYYRTKFSGMLFSGLSSYYTNHFSRRFFEIRNEYERASPEQQTAYREMRNFSFLHNDKNIEIKHGFYEIDLNDNGFTDTHCLRAQSCRKWSENGDVYHSGQIDQTLREKFQIIGVIWKNGRVFSTKILIPAHDCSLADELKSNNNCPKCNKCNCTKEIPCSLDCKVRKEIIF